MDFLRWSCDIFVLQKSIQKSPSQKNGKEIRQSFSTVIPGKTRNSDTALKAESYRQVTGKLTALKANITNLEDI